MPNMNAKFILRIFSILIVLMGIYGDAVCSKNQPEPEKMIVLSTGMPESMSHFPEIAEFTRRPLNGLAIVSGL